MDGRLQPKRHAESLHDGAQELDRRGRDMEREHAAPRMPRDQARELVLGDVAGSRDEERLSHRLEPVEGEQEAGHEVVDVHRMVERTPRAHHRIAAPGDRPEQLQQARLAGPVDGPGTDNCHREAARPLEGESQGLSLGLGLLVDVARGEGRGLVGRGVHHVAVHAHGRRVHEPLEAPSGRRRQEALGPPDVHVAIVGIGMAGGPVDRGHVNNRVSPLEQPLDRAPVQEVPLDQPGAGGAQGLGHRGGPDQGRDLIPSGAKGFEQPPARVSGGPGEGDVHQRSLPASPRGPVGRAWAFLSPVFLDFGRSRSLT